MNIIFHIDVNNAFLSWTAIKLLNDGYHEDIRKIPSVIGGDEEKRHGIVLAKSDVAKKHGIKTAETLYSARRKCPGLQVFKGDMYFYKEMSNKLYQYFLEFTPDVERYSIDECFLDMSNTNYLYDDIVKLAYKMKDEIKEKLGFTVNIGIGNNKLCAKMAGDFSKPDKVHTLFQNEIKDKMWPLPVEDLLYIGKKSGAELRNLGINTIGDLANTDPFILKRYFKNQVEGMINYARGLDDTKVISKSGKNKCISVSETLEEDTTNKTFLKKKLLIMCERIGIQLRHDNLYAKTIAITVKTDYFKSYSHQKKIINQTNNTMELYKNILDIFDDTIRDEKIRSIGVRVSDLIDFKNNQISLFDTSNKENDDKVQGMLDNINDKYNSLKIMPAIFYEDDL